MPQLRTPTSLFQAALQSVQESVLSSCLLIQKKFGTYDKVNCQAITKELQEYLVDNLPGRIIDILFNSTHGVKNLFRNNLDFRILFSVYMHDNMQLFCPQIKVSADDKFWQSKLRTMKNLIILDLNLICTDEILKVVGKNCKKLEFINIVSKTEELSCSFNALKVNYFVSDLGLQYISRCKNLQVVIMPKIIRSQSSGFKITHDGIMYMLKSLPNLKLLTYSDIGSVLINNIDPYEPLQLSLTSIIAYQCDNLPTSLILQVCPHLTELHLDCSSFMSPIVETNMSETLRLLAINDIKLTTLSIHIYDFCDSFKLFLERKGKYITTISLTVDSDFDVSDVLYLGECCPKVEKVHLYTTDRFEDCSGYRVSDSMFTELKILILEMFLWSNILTLFLKNAVSIKQLVLNSLINNEPLDNVIDNIMILNSFQELEELHIGIRLSSKCLMKFILFCPVLKKVTVSEDLVYFEQISKINEILKAKNLNTKVIMVRSTLRYNTSPFTW